MILVIKKADFSSDNIGTINLKISTKETLDILSNMTMYSQDSSQAYALDKLIKSLKSIGIWDNIAYFMPVGFASENDQLSYNCIAGYTASMPATDGFIRDATGLIRSGALSNRCAELITGVPIGNNFFFLQSKIAGNSGWLTSANNGLMISAETATDWDSAYISAAGNPSNKLCTFRVGNGSLAPLEGVLIKLNSVLDTSNINGDNFGVAYSYGYGTAYQKVRLGSYAATIPVINTTTPIVQKYIGYASDNYIKPWHLNIIGKGGYQPTNEVALAVINAIHTYQVSLGMV